MPRRVLAAMLMVGLCGVPAVAQATPATGAGGGAAKAARAPRPGAEAAAALRAAKAVADEARGKDRETRIAILRRAAAAYEAIPDAHAGDRGGVLRAHLEAGDLWRRAGDLERSRAALEKALAMQEPAVEARLRLDLADLDRRTGRPEPAATGYRAVLALVPGSSRGHRAWLGLASLCRGAKDLDGEIAVLREAAAATEHPTRYVELSDRLGKALVRSGALDDAAAAIAAAEQRARAVIDAGGKAGERLARKVAEMGARRALQRARDRAGAGDIDDLDRDG